MSESFVPGDLVYTGDIPMPNDYGQYVRQGGPATVIEDAGGYRVRIAYHRDGATFELPRELVHRERRRG